MLKLGIRLRKDSWRIHIQGLHRDFTFNNNAHFIYLQIIPSSKKSYLGRQCSIDKSFCTSLNLSPGRGAIIK